MSFDFYKMDPSAWNAGTRLLSAEQIGCLLLFCHEIYIHKEDVPNDVGVLGRIWKVHPNKARKMLSDLIGAGKITLTPAGQLTNLRARHELDEREMQARSRAHAAKTGARHGRDRTNTEPTQDRDKGDTHTRHTRDAPETDVRRMGDGSGKPNDINGASEHLLPPKRRVEERREEKRSSESRSQNESHGEDAAAAADGSDHRDPLDRFGDADAGPSTPCPDNWLDDIPPHAGPDDDGQPEPHGPVTVTPGPDAQPVKAKAEKRATRIPDEWVLGSISDAERKVWTDLGLPDSQALLNWDTFVDYYRGGGPGKNATRTDWTATWRNWARGEVKNMWKHQKADQALRAAQPAQPGQAGPKFDRYGKPLGTSGMATSV